MNQGRFADSRRTQCYGFIGRTGQPDRFFHASDVLGPRATSS